MTKPDNLTTLAHLHGYTPPTGKERIEEEMRRPGYRLFKRPLTQKPADDGLFDVAARKQGDLFND